MAKALTTKDYTFYTSAEYWPALIARIDQTKSGERIALMTMDFFPADPIIKKLLQSLLQAAKRGVEVRLVVDARPLLFNPRSQRLGPLWYSHKLSKLSEPFKQHLEAIQAMNAQPSGQGVIINKPSRNFGNPFAGRSHIKFSLINDEVFIGSSNLQGKDSLELMVALKDKRTADYVYSFVRDVMETEHVGQMLNWQDQQLKIDGAASLIIDAGKRKQSTIFENALQLIDEAQQAITITCQFFPNTITAQHLVAAYRRGVKVRILFPPPGKHGKLAFIQYYTVWREKRRVPAELFGAMLRDTDPLLHTKLLVTDKGTMIGSHNYVHTGVRLGTAEIALINHDPAFGKAALAALQRDLS